MFVSKWIFSLLKTSKSNINLNNFECFCFCWITLSYFLWNTFYRFILRWFCNCFVLKRSIIVASFKIYEQLPPSKLNTQWDAQRTKTKYRNTMKVLFQNIQQNPVLRAKMHDSRQRNTPWSSLTLNCLQFQCSFRWSQNKNKTEQNSSIVVVMRWLPLFVMFLYRSHYIGC